MKSRARYIGPFLIFLLVTGQSVEAQFLSGGARAAGMGNASVALSGDSWGETNPATWATVSKRTVSFFASEAFGLAELRYSAFHALQPTRFGTFAVGASRFGFDEFRETHIDAGFSRGFSLGTTRKFFAAAKFRYYNVSLARYGNSDALGLSVGWLVNIFPSFQAGFSATNINVPKLAGRDEFERSFSFGISHQPNPRFLILLDLYKDVRFPISFRSGIEIHPLPMLALRAGMTAQPTRFTSGLGIRLDWLEADFAAERHEVLGWSPSFSITVTWR